MNAKIRTKITKLASLVLITALFSIPLSILPTSAVATPQSATWTTKGDFLNNQVLGPDFILGTVDDGTAGPATLVDSIVISNSNSPADSVTLDNVWQNIGSPNAISTVTAEQRESAVIYNYNDSQDEFLTVWVDSRAGSADWSIYAQRLDSNGTAIGPEISVSTATTRERFPDVSYNSVNNEYLVTWSDYRLDNPYVPGSRTNIYAQRILANGTKSGSEINVSGNSLQLYPKVSYDPDTNQYLIVWEDNRNSTRDIYGRLVKADGTFGSVETNLTPNTNSISQFKPAVGYSPVKKQHVLAWEESPAPYGIFAQAVSSTLSPIGSAKEVAPSTTPQSSPALIYKPVSDEFLLLWNEQPNWPTNSRTDVYGQKINADVDLLGQQLIISDNPFYQNYPLGSYSPLLDQFLVIWSDSRNNVGEVYGQAVTGDGSLVGSNFAIKQGGTSSVPGGIAYSDLSNKFLVSFSDYSVGGGDLFGQLVGYPYLPTGNITGLKINAREKSKWSSISWNGLVPANNTAIKFRTRGADSEAGLASASWSDYYTTSGSAISTPDSQWLEIEATLVSTDGLQTPTLNDLTVNYDVVTSGQDPGTIPTNPNNPNPIPNNPGPSKTILSTNLSIWAKPKAVKAGKATTIKGRLKDSAGKPVVGRKVVLKQKVLQKIKKKVKGKIKTINKWIWKAIANLTTDSKGNFSKKLKPKITSIYKASYAGEGSYKAANSEAVKITVKKPKKKKK